MNVQYEDKKTFDGTAQYARNKRVQVWVIASSQRLTWWLLTWTEVEKH